MQLRERRSRRQRERAAAAQRDLEAQFVREPRGSQGAGCEARAAAEVEVTVEVEGDLDARELEPWFRALPPVEQARLREVWAASRRRFDATGGAARSRRLRAAWQGAAVFTANALLLTLVGLSPWRAAVYAPAGAAAGLLGLAIGGERFHFMAAGALMFGLLEGAGLAANPFLLYGMLFAVASMGLVGLDREMRASAGERDG